jgi:hypothetical protein
MISAVGNVPDRMMKFLHRSGKNAVATFVVYS